MENKGFLSKLIKNKIYTVSELFPEIEEENERICQEKTGYCWLISTLNCIEKYLQRVKRYEIDFSKNYLFFFDKLEKANFFLENIILCLNHQDNDRVVKYLLCNAMTDKGQWSMAKNLIEKYGMIPYEEMKDTKYTKNTGELNASISFILRYYATIIRDLYSSEKNKKNEIMKCKDIAMKEIYNLLISCFGVPPKEITIKTGNNMLRNIKPLELYRRFINFPFQEYVSICDVGNDNLEYLVNYNIALDGNIFGAEKNSFLNIKSEYFNDFVLSQIEDEGFCWIGCDGGKFYISNASLYDDSIFDFSTITKYDILNDIDRHKVYMNCMASNSHAMVLCKKKETLDGKKFLLAKDSAIKSEQTNGYCAISEGWFEKYIFQAVVKWEYVMKCFKKQNIKNKIIKPWEFFPFI